MEYIDKIIIITINYNQINFTLGCIDSILKTNYKNFQLLIIDNGSTEENFSILKNNLPKDNKVHLHRIEKNRGYVGGVNYGLREGLKMEPDYYIVMNNDTIIDNNAVGELIQTCKRYGNRAIVTGLVKSYDNPNIIQTTGTLLTNKNKLTGFIIGAGESDTGQFIYEEERDIIDDVFWLFHKDILKNIGLYSEWFGFGYEQAEWALRAKKAGFKLIFSPKAVLWHKGNLTVGIGKRSIYKTFWNIQGLLMFRYLFQKRRYFLITYFVTWGVIIKGFFTDLIALFFKKFEYRFSMIMLLSMIRFHVWLIKKMPYYKYIPKIIQRNS